LRRAPGKNSLLPVTAPAVRAYMVRRSSGERKPHMKKNLVRSLLLLSVLAVPALAWAGNALVRATCPVPCPFCP
jgi:hypothetical protein